MADSSKWNRRSVIKATGIGAIAALTCSPSPGFAEPEHLSPMVTSSSRSVAGATKAFRSKSWPTSRSGWGSIGRAADAG